MPTLSQQSQSLVENYKKLHIDSLKRQGSPLVPYLKRIDDNPDWFKGVKFKSSGEIIHGLLLGHLREASEAMEENHPFYKVYNDTIDSIIQDDGSMDLSKLESLKIAGDDSPVDAVKKSLQELVQSIPRLADVLNEYAKINDIFRRLRAIEYNERDEIEHKGIIADDFGYTLSKLHKEGRTQEEVQEVINHTNFTPSLTAHPTNPQSVEYVGVAMNLVKILTDPMSQPKEVGVAMDKLTSSKLRVTPDKNKTQELEIDEVLHYLDAIWDSVDEQYEILTSAIKESKYPNLILPDNLNQICVWVAGDGDGNKNATPESLKMNIDKFRMVIKRKYVHELSRIKGNMDIIASLDLGEIKTPEELIDAIKERHGPDCEKENPQIKSLLRKIRTFGFHYAKIDIRHTAVDLVKVKDVVDLAFDKYKDRIEGDNDQQKRQEILKGILDEKIDLSQIGIDENTIELTKRIAGRFVIASQNPDMFEKIIAAEFDDPEQIKAVLQLLKDTGNKIGIPGSNLSIVPLAESRSNLQKLHTDIATALNNDEYFEHLKQTKKVYFMIARSDTVRRDGVGAQDSQEHAITDSVKTIAKILIDKVKKGVITKEDLKNFQIIPYSGGGNALQRGGGKMTELASVYGRYCLNGLNELEEELAGRHDHGALDLLKIVKSCVKEPCLTTQGHQNALLYQEGGKKLARFISQAVYGRSRTIGLIKNKGIDIATLQKIYIKRIVEYIGRDLTVEDFENPQQIIAAIVEANKNKGIAKELITAVKFYYTRQEGPDFEEQNNTIKEEFSKLLKEKSKLATKNLTEISDNAVAEYKIHIGSEETAAQGISSPVDGLLNYVGPWYFTKMGNVSSRGNVRGKVDAAKDKTFGELKGKDPKVLAQRAIGVESVSTHSGTGAVAFLGWKNAIYQHFDIEDDLDVSQIDQENVNRLQELFCCSKSFRDLMRSAEMTISQTDFEKAWSALYDEPNDKDTKVFRPSADDIKDLYDEYQENIKNKTLERITSDQTLAYLDYQASQTRNLIQLIAGGRSTCSEFTAEEAVFKKECQVANNLEAAITVFGNNNPEVVITKILSYVMRPVYAATDCDAKPGLLMEPQRKRGLSRGVSPEESRPSSALENTQQDLGIVSKLHRLANPIDRTRTASPGSSPEALAGQGVPLRVPDNAQTL